MSQKELLLEKIKILLNCADRESLAVFVGMLKAMERGRKVHGR